MARTVQQVRVFVASPSDVQSERNRLARIIRETNVGYLSTSPFQLELIGWETHTHPSFGKDTQSVINDQIGSDYDVFVGILWSRIGTPTRSAASGTLEEFYLAYKRWQADPRSIELMLYFKDEPIAPSQLDPDQLRQINAFRNDITNLGGLYHTFVGTDEFETSIRLHLAQLMQGWSKRSVSRDERMYAKNSSPFSVEPREVPTEPDDELGFLDYRELFDEAAVRLSTVAASITHALAEVGANTEKRTAETRNLLAAKEPSVALAREIFDQSAKDLAGCGKREGASYRIKHRDVQTFESRCGERTHNRAGCSVIYRPRSGCRRGILCVGSGG